MFQRITKRSLVTAGFLSGAFILGRKYFFPNQNVSSRLAIPKIYSPPPPTTIEQVFSLPANSVDDVDQFIHKIGIELNKDTPSEVVELLVTQGCFRAVPSSNQTLDCIFGRGIIDLDCFDEFPPKNFVKIKNFPKAIIDPSINKHFNSITPEGWTTIGFKKDSQIDQNKVDEILLMLINEGFRCEHGTRHYLGPMIQIQNSPLKFNQLISQKALQFSNTSELKSNGPRAL